ncbi:GNAT family N-acetyltransferase [Niallia sp. BSM11]|uniref:GNAT family N-acetyltransferase n=1 Tax=Niallia sp. BSM11 TaxID=3391576 RepID=UPI0039849787
MIQIRNVKETDLERLLTIENEGFTKEEAATKEAFLERIALIKDTFLVAEKEGKIIGYINGPIIPYPYITDDLFESIQQNPSAGGFQSILGLAVAKEARYKGVSLLLMNKLKELVIKNNRLGITLTCKEELIPFYEKLGFKNHGLSESQHAGTAWYNLIYKI